MMLHELCEYLHDLGLNVDILARTLLAHAKATKKGYHLLVCSFSVCILLAILYAILCLPPLPLSVTFNKSSYHANKSFGLSMYMLSTLSVLC